MEDLDLIDLTCEQCGSTIGYGGPIGDWNCLEMFCSKTCAKEYYNK